MIRPRINPYTICPSKLATTGHFPNGWFQGDSPVIGLCIGINVTIQTIKPYNIPSKSNDSISLIKDGKREIIMNGKAIPTRVPFRKWNKKIPLIWIVSFSSFEMLNSFLVITWFSCHSKTPYRCHFLQDGISVNVITTVDTRPPIKP